LHRLKVSDLLSSLAADMIEFQHPGVFQAAFNLQVEPHPYGLKLEVALHHSVFLN